MSAVVVPRPAAKPRRGLVFVALRHPDFRTVTCREEQAVLLLEQRTVVALVARLKRKLGCAGRYELEGRAGQLGLLLR